MKTILRTPCTFALRQSRNTEKHQRFFGISKRPSIRFNTTDFIGPINNPLAISPPTVGELIIYSNFFLKNTSTRVLFVFCVQPNQMDLLPFSCTSSGMLDIAATLSLSLLLYTNDLLKLLGYAVESAVVGKHISNQRNTDTNTKGGYRRTYVKMSLSLPPIGLME